MKRMKVDDAVKALDDIDGQGDPEGAHGEADEILLKSVPAPVAEAYKRLVDRARWWARA